jgi:hypothetical protein
VDRVVLVARLRPGVRDRAEALLTEEARQKGPERFFRRGTIFLSDSEVIFFLEGDDAEVIVRTVLNDPAESTVIEPWLPLFDGPLHRARESRTWET